MKFYPENYNVALDVLFTDKAGAPIVPTVVRAVLLDGDDELIADFGLISFDPADSKVSIVIPAEDNVLGVGELSAVRSLRVLLEAETVIYPRVHSYVIEAESRLEILNNSFLTLPAAELLARDNPSLSGWAAASEEKKVAALINAYARLSRVQVRYAKPKEDTQATMVTPLPQLRYREHCPWEVVIAPGEWSLFTKEDFLKMPADFRAALRQAQLIEANDVLTENPYEARHRAGVISETVGESSIMLRGGKLELGVSNAALRALTGFVYYNVRLARG